MKTSEMIAMLEKNPSLKFKDMGKETGSCKSDVYAYLDHKKVLRWAGEDQGNPVALVLREGWGDWQLVREPVPVWEAVKAFYEGKTIRCEGYRRTKDDFCMVKGCTFSKDSCATSLGMSCIRNGIFYIEEPANG